MLHFLLIGTLLAARGLSEGPKMCLNDFIADTRSSCQLWDATTNLKRQISAFGNCYNVEMKKEMVDDNVVQMSYQGRLYLMAVDDPAKAWTQTNAFFRGKFAFDEDHAIALTYMLGGRKFHVEDDRDMATFLRLPAASRSNNVLMAMINNTEMPTPMPTKTATPTMAPTSQPTTLMCQTVFGWGGDGHGVYTLFRNQITLWGGHGNYRQGGTLRQPTAPEFGQISHGHWNMAALKLDGSITIYGNRNQYYNKNPNTKNFVWIQSGNDFGCAMTNENTLNCFGNTGGSWSGVTTNFPKIDDIIAYQCGGYFCCLVDSDLVMDCWGRNNEGQAPATIMENDPSKDGGYIDVATGHHFTVGIKADRTPRCWGQNNGRQISDCPTTEKFRFVSCGGYYCCGMRYDYDENEEVSGPRDNDLRCWGYDQHAQVRGLPKRAGQDGIKARALITNHHGSCALRMKPGYWDFQPICWGLDNNNYFPHGGDMNEFIKARFPCEMDEVMMPYE